MLIALKIFTDEEVNDFLVVNFSKSFKVTREKFYTKLVEEKTVVKFTESFYTFLTPDKVGRYVELTDKTPEIKILMHSIFSNNCVQHYNINILIVFDPELQLINTKTIIKNKFIDLLGELKKF